LVELGFSGRVNTEWLSDTLRQGEAAEARSWGSGDSGGKLPCRRNRIAKSCIRSMYTARKTA
jgi:hypothetical protein